MGLLLWILFGGIAGWIASIIFGNNSEQGLLGNIVVGIVGAFIGGLIVNLIGGEGITGFNLYSMAVAVGGAILTLFTKKALFR